MPTPIDDPRAWLFADLAFLRLVALGMRADEAGDVVAQERAEAAIEAAVDRFDREAPAIVWVWTYDPKGNV